MSTVTAMTEAATMDGQSSVDVDVAVFEVDQERGRDILDRAALRWLNMSGVEFAKRWDSGEFVDDPSPAVTKVSLLLPFGG